MRTPILFAALLASTSLVAQTATPGPGPEGPAITPTHVNKHAGPERDLMASLSEVLKLSSQQQYQLDAELKRLRQRHQAQRTRHHQTMRRQHQQDLRDLERLFEPHQAELYRAFLRGLELGRSTPPPQHPPQRKITKR